MGCDCIFPWAHARTLFLPCSIIPLNKKNDSGCFSVQFHILRQIQCHRISATGFGVRMAFIFFRRRMMPRWGSNTRLLIVTCYFIVFVEYLIIFACLNLLPLNAHAQLSKLILYILFSLSYTPYYNHCHKATSSPSCRYYLGACSLRLSSTFSFLGLRQSDLSRFIVISSDVWFCAVNRVLWFI